MINNKSCDVTLRKTEIDKVCDLSTGPIATDQYKSDWTSQLN